MKSAKFEYERTDDLADALKALSSKHKFSKILAGSQSLGPMMNLRLAQPDHIVDIRALSALKKIKLEHDALFIGALVTHADVEDGKLPDVTKGLMTHVASGIAYRAVRNRGTIGGSIVHADPAGDWPAVLLALGAKVLIESRGGTIEMPLSRFQKGIYEVALEENEILRGIRIPILSDFACWGYHKICRKPGEFAQSIGCFVSDRKTGIERLVLGGTEDTPLELNDVAKNIAKSKGKNFDTNAASDTLVKTGKTFEPFKLQMHSLALHRAVAQAYSQR